MIRNNYRVCKKIIFLIEDCCDALAQSLMEKQLDLWEFCISKFYPAHHITTGEGGAVLYNDYKMKKIVESLEIGEEIAGAKQE